MLKKTLFLFLVLFSGTSVFASEANLKIPTLNDDQQSILVAGIFICILGLIFGVYQYFRVKKLKAHQSMLDIAQVIFETCKTYLLATRKIVNHTFHLYCGLRVILFWFFDAHRI